MTQHVFARTTRIVVVIALTGSAMACGRTDRPPSAGALALAARATGVWDAALRLERTPFGAASGQPVVVHGPLALVESRAREGREWLRRPTTHVGVHALDLRPLGFVPESPGPVSSLVAAVGPPDTLVAVTPPGTDGGSLELRGTLTARADSVRGTWSYVVRGAGAWGGTFTLRRRAAVSR